MKKTFSIISLSLLLFLFNGCSPSNQNSSTQPSHENQNPTNTFQTEQKPKEFSLTIKNKKLIDGPSVIKVTEGDKILITITSDQAEEFHLHGYDVKVNVEKDKPAQLLVITKLTGHFPYELEKSGTEIGALEVTPQ